VKRTASRWNVLLLMWQRIVSLLLSMRDAVFTVSPNKQ
jgi:hypothetical protein